MSLLDALPWVLLALVGLVGSSLCSGMETGYYAHSRVRLALRVAYGPRQRSAARLERLTADPNTLLGTLLIGNNIFNYFGVLGLTAILELLGYSEAAIVLLNTALVTPVLLAFGEALPKELFRRFADTLLPRLEPLLRGMHLVFLFVGLIPLVRGATSVVQRVAKLTTEPTLDRRGEMAAMLSESAAQQSMIERAFSMRQHRVGQEMVPWKRVVRVGTGWDRERLLTLLAQSPLSRFPVVDQRGMPIGVLNHLDVHLQPDASVVDLATPVPSIDPSLGVREALRELQNADATMAFVERAGKIVGIVTLKDLVEPLTGELAAW